MKLRESVVVAAREASETCTRPSHDGRPSMLHGRGIVCERSTEKLDWFVVCRSPCRWYQLVLFYINLEACHVQAVGFSAALEQSSDVASGHVVLHTPYFTPRTVATTVDSDGRRANT